jgi:hypothetical protein
LVGSFEANGLERQLAPSVEVVSDCVVLGIARAQRVEERVAEAEQIVGFLGE